MAVYVVVGVAVGKAICGAVHIRRYVHNDCAMPTVRDGTCIAYMYVYVCTHVHECRYYTMLKDDYKEFIANVDGNDTRVLWRNTILNATSNSGDPLKYDPDFNACFNENEICRYLNMALVKCEVKYP